MPIGEIFPYSTVKKVIFQIRYPNLFFIESKIGDYQLLIMEKFPESSLLLRKQMFVAEVGPNLDLEKFKDVDPEQAVKIWNFKSEKGFELNVTSNSLDITSDFHKTYNLEGTEEKFRDIIALTVDHFLKITGIPVISRIGFRYIDECPIPRKDNETINSYYNVCFPLERFDISQATEMDFKTVIRKDGCGLRYAESLKKVGDDDKLILDFDGFAENIKSFDYLATTDKLHKFICDEFKVTLKEPAIHYMRTGELR